MLTDFGNGQSGSIVLGPPLRMCSLPASSFPSGILDLRDVVVAVLDIRPGLPAQGHERFRHANPGPGEPTFLPPRPFRHVRAGTVCHPSCASPEEGSPRLTAPDQGAITR